jgi:hypothetical protein
MKNKELIKAALVFVTGLVCGIVIGLSYLYYWCGAHETVRDTTTYVDTVAYYKPIPKDSAVIRYVTRYLPVAKDTNITENYAHNQRENIPPSVLSDDRDSAAVVIPVTQRRYEGDEYLAYVSGYEPTLDSIFVYPKTTVIRESTYKPPDRWHIGITGGYGISLTGGHAEPFIGVGITYSILSFK